MIIRIIIIISMIIRIIIIGTIIIRIIIISMSTEWFCVTDSLGAEWVVDGVEVQC